MPLCVCVVTGRVVLRRVSAQVEAVLLLGRVLVRGAEVHAAAVVHEREIFFLLGLVHVHAAVDDHARGRDHAHLELAPRVVPKTKQGKVIQFKNKPYYGGFISIIDTIIGNERECYINNVPCLAQIHQDEIIITTIH